MVLPGEEQPETRERAHRAQRPYLLDSMFRTRVLEYLIHSSHRNRLARLDSIFLDLVRVQQQHWEVPERAQRAQRPCLQESTCQRRVLRQPIHSLLHSRLARLDSSFLDLVRVQQQHWEVPERAQRAQRPCLQESTCQRRVLRQPIHSLLHSRLARLDSIFQEQVLERTILLDLPERAWRVLLVK